MTDQKDSVSVVGQLQSDGGSDSRIASVADHKALKLALAEAERTQREVERRWRERRDELMAAASAKADGEFQHELSVVREAARNARAAELAERDRLASEGVGAPHPIGTRMVEWGRGGNRFWSHSSPLVKTGVVGVVEMFTRASKSPGNRVWNQPEVGDAVIRLLKKDGSPGIKCIPFSAWEAKNFSPEGVDPNEAERAK